MTFPFARQVGKTAALQQLGRIAGLGEVSLYGESVETDLAGIARLIPPATNLGTQWAQSGQLGLPWVPHHCEFVRSMRPPRSLGPRPACFGQLEQYNANSPGLRVLDLPGGIFAHVFGAPLTMNADGKTVVADATSRYAPLLHYVDFSLDEVVASARMLDGTAVVITDDIRPLNYSHWLLDWLPRLAFLGRQARLTNTFVVTTPLVTEFQRQSLEMCGFSPDRIIELADFSAIRARRLLVPADIRNIPHPCFKGAPWAISFLRDTLGLPSFVLHRSTEPARKLYVSRDDAARRKVLNDAEFSAMLSSQGYAHVTLSNMKLSEQIYVFANATHIISLHGAGLSNLAFCSPGTQVIELFPETYGTPAFYALADALNLSYYAYIAGTDTQHSVSQYHDVVVDVAAFRDACSSLLL